MQIERGISGRDFRRHGGGKRQAKGKWKRYGLTPIWLGLKDLLKKMSKNAAKREPIEEAIKGAEDTIQKYGGFE